jgi:hypothetical protein
LEVLLDLGLFAGIGCCLQFRYGKHGKHGDDADNHQELRKREATVPLESHHAAFPPSNDFIPFNR